MKVDKLQTNQIKQKMNQMERIKIMFINLIENIQNINTRIMKMSLMKQ